jgi:putative membrane protein
MKMPFLALALPALLLAADEPMTEDYKDAKTEAPMREDLKEAPVADTEPSGQDIEALAQLHHVNEVEVKLGKLAKQNGKSKQVKAYGEVLVRDHTLADKQLRSFAKHKNIELTLPAAKSPEEQAEREASMDAAKRLETLKGEEFDVEFTQMMVDDHTRAVNLVQTTLTSTQNAKVHALLTRLLPVLEEHLRLARSIQKTLQNV